MLTAELVSVVLVMAILLLALFRSGLTFDAAQLNPATFKLADGRLGFVLGFMMLAGFESTTALSEETKGAATSIPRAMLTCLIPVGVLYLISIYALRALSQKYAVALDQSALPFDTLAGLIGLPMLGWFSSAGIALSCYTCIIAGLNAGSRILFAMSRRGDLPLALSQTAESTGNPVFAVNGLALVAGVIMAAVLAFRITLSQGIDFLVQIASLGFLGAYLGVGIAAPIYLLRKKLFTPAKVLTTSAALLAVICAAAFSLYPLPPAPWRYLPLCYAACLLFGGVYSFFTHRTEEGAAEGAPV
jgi:amino acid transporter